MSQELTQRAMQTSYHTEINMRSSILKEAINVLLDRKASKHMQDLELRETAGATFHSPGNSSSSSPSSSMETSPTGSNRSSRKNSTIIEEAKSSTSKGKSRYRFYSTNLVERRIIQPGSQCLPFPWKMDSDSKTSNN